MGNKMEKDVETVGEILRNARLKNGKTLSDVADELCIRKVYLLAIEEMDFNNIPEMPYGLGFIRSYAQYLGLNSDRIVASYRQMDTEEKGRKLHEDEKEVTASKPTIKHVLFGILGLIAVIAASVVISMRKHESNMSAVETKVVVAEPEIVEEIETQDSDIIVVETDEEDEQRVAEEENSQADNENVSETEGTESASEENVEDKNEPVVVERHIRFELTGPSWLELRQGNSILLSGLYKKGFAYEIPNKEETYITVGRHYNIQFYVDNQPVNVVSAMNKKDVKLDSYMKAQEVQE